MIRSRSLPEQNNATTAPPRQLLRVGCVFVGLLLATQFLSYLHWSGFLSPLEELPSENRSEKGSITHSEALTQDCIPGLVVSSGEDGSLAAMRMALFASGWVQRPQTCVFPCDTIRNVSMRIQLRGTPPNGRDECPPKITCRALEHVLIFHVHKRLIQRIHKSPPLSCVTHSRRGVRGDEDPKIKDETREYTVTCPMPGKTDCIGHAWNEWTMEVVSGKKNVARTHFYHLHIPPDRPFQISSIYPTSNQSFVQLVTFYGPNLFLPASSGSAPECNRIYCIYRHQMKKANHAQDYRGIFKNTGPPAEIGRYINNKKRGTNYSWEIYPAEIGEVSLVICPKPRVVDFKTELMLSYDMKIVSAPRTLDLEPHPRDISKTLPYAYLSVCAMVKGEHPQRLREWIEYHRIVGYDRIIIYDNNVEPDTNMDTLLLNYKDFVIVRKWPHRHSQTEAFTDCIIRYSLSTEWLSLLDADEFAVPASPYASVPQVLRTFTVQSKDHYVHSRWLTFGPCDNSTLSTSQRNSGHELPLFGLPLTMDVCVNITRSSSPNPKTTVRAREAASMQGYGPHYVKLARDVNKVHRSVSLDLSEYLTIYHYRYRTWQEYFSRRVGDIAGLSDGWTEEKLRADWALGVKYSQTLPPSHNRILRFLPQLRRAMNNA